jgi:nitrate/TMAO reductase-like tetraheme cytochrome c subunit
MSWRYVKASAAAMLAGAGIALALMAAVLGGEAVLSTKAFCTSCHSMTYPAQELGKSSHYGRVGADPECRNCHIPQGLANFHRAVWAHLVYGTRDLIAEFTHDYSNLKAFNARRLEMAHFARMVMKGEDSLTCRECHRNPRPSAPEGKEAHGKLASAGATCIDCHQNLVHREVPETDLDKSLAQGRMVLKED